MPEGDPRMGRNLQRLQAGQFRQREVSDLVAEEDDVARALLPHLPVGALDLLAADPQPLEGAAVKLVGVLADGVATATDGLDDLARGPLDQVAVLPWSSPPAP
jgi:hypothetical protein